MDVYVCIVVMGIWMDFSAMKYGRKKGRNFL